MKTVWLDGLRTSEERENFKAQILSSKNVLDKLNKIVYNMYNQKRDVEFSDYDSPSWLAKQAHANGYCEALRSILEILDVKA